MNRDEIVQKLRAERQHLRKKFGVQSLALFGSVARDEATDKSDVDLLVEFDRRISLFDLVDTALYLEKLLGVGEDKVDLVIRDAVIPELQDIIYGEAVHVFNASPLEVPHSTHS